MTITNLNLSPLQFVVSRINIVNFNNGNKGIIMSSVKVMILKVTIINPGSSIKSVVKSNDGPTKCKLTINCYIYRSTLYIRLTFFSF